MNTVALLGAGFSRNWGGRLAAEMRSDIIGRLAHVGQDLVHCFDHQPDFEDVLAQLQSEHAAQNTAQSRTRLDRMQAAIADAFDTMNRGFEEMQKFEPSTALKFSVRKFLSRFDAIFTTNQDLLLELHYNSVGLFDNPERPVRWAGWYLPGMRGPPNAWNAPIWEKRAMLWAPEEEFHLEANSQPVFKLHGSTNWHGRRGENVMIVGRDKGVQIAQHRILRWYFDQFHERLRRPDTRLMAIGYSFSDPHIDQAICDAHAAAGQLGVFYFGPRGREVLNKALPFHVRIPHICESVCVLGESTRNFRETFAGDGIEFDNVCRFFQRLAA